MKLLQYYKALSLLCFLSLSTVFAAKDPIGVSLSPAGGFPLQTQLGGNYTISYTLVNNLPTKKRVNVFVYKQKGNLFVVNNQCNTILNPAGRAGSACNVSINFIPTDFGRATIQLAMQYDNNIVPIPPVKTRVTSNPPPPPPPPPVTGVITWPGRNQGTALVDANGNGVGSFVANAFDTTGQPVIYTFGLNGPGTILGNQNGFFLLSNAIGQNETAQVTATAIDALPVVGGPIPIVRSNIPAKRIAIYNNSPIPIYPIIETPIQPVDHWLQAQFQVTNINTDTFEHTNLYRVYINPLTGGIPPGRYAIVSVPFYSALTTNPTPSTPDQYIDWWNAVRVYLYDYFPSLAIAYNADRQNPVTPLTPALFCEIGSACLGPLPTYASTTGLPLNSPSQLTEYTFANVVTGLSVPYPIDRNYVDYDISYVDHTYLPVAMESYGNSMIGYTGTVMDLVNFRSIVHNFINTEQWPIYVATPQYPAPKVPGTYNVLIGNQPLTEPNTTQTVAELTTYWLSCLNNIAHPRHLQCLNVNDLFTKNYANYQTLCLDNTPLSTLNLLQHVYGWVAFTCTGVTNNLASTPGANYTQAENSYQILQYTPPFNPYVQLIHSATYLNMNAYAFSIDDAVGNMNVRGAGVVIAIGGAQGLPNPNPFNKNATANVNLGAPVSGGASWLSYGICSATPNQNFDQGVFSFQIQTVTYPCVITLQDSNNLIYRFTVLAPPPFQGGNTSTYINCNLSPPSTQAWCQGINIDFNTRHDIDTPSPVI
ncbi:Thaumatin domain-containing protein [Legionella beliardensis]|uniref:Thaumatin domain-containing protein n=1 Tax=Legionella beliardensis TaxID=91822 RepID=A0A378I4M8_9GAMM|nr:hypothetical protein [Legionella beliardensis]STX29700.1 Thaumatin domain-containing protein [Legionella beliardensis]